MTVNTQLSAEEIRAAAIAYGLSNTDADALTIHILPAVRSVTAYPGNSHGVAFLKHLCDAGKAKLRE